MASRKYSLEILRKFLPNDAAYDYILTLLENQALQLSIKKERKRIFGNYIWQKDLLKSSHSITINGNLPPYQFYITLLHELAHYYTNIQHGSRVQAHGAEWKKIFALFLQNSLSKNIFPTELQKVIIKYAHNPKASSCVDIDLYNALYKFENIAEEYTLLGIQAPQVGEIIETKDHKVFEIIEKLRKNYKLKLLKNGNMYIAPPTMEIKVVKPQ